MLGEGAEVVAGAGDAGGSGDAAEAEDRGALDVRRERHPVYQAGVDGGRSDAGDRSEEDGRDIRGGEAQRGERAGDGLFAQINRGGNPLVVGLLKADEFGLSIQRKYGVTEVDAAVGV